MFDYYRAASPVIALGVNVLVQVLVARANPRWYLRSVVAGFGAGLISLFAISGLPDFYQSAPWQDVVAVMLVNTAAYAALSFCFLYGIVMNCRSSVRVRLFRELQQSERGLSMEQILSQYNQRRIVEVRLERLLKGEQLVLREGRYFLNSPALWFLDTVIRFAKMLVTGKDSEFSGMTPLSHEDSPPDTNSVTKESDLSELCIESISDTKDREQS